MTEFSPTKPVSRWEWLVPAAISAVLIASCILISPKKPVWFDEVITWVISADPSLRHSISTAADLSPTYYLVIHFWRRIFGGSVLGLRLLSSCGFSLAVFASWATLRRSFSFAPAALAHVVVFCTSSIVLYQNVELRFYGVLAGITGLALFLYARLLVSERPSAKLLVATAVVHTALVLCHLYGFLYSAALLTALVISDLRLGRRRTWIYAMIVASWFTLLPWIMPVIRVARLGRIHSWSQAPGAGDLFAAYEWMNLPFLVGAACLALLLFKLGSRQPVDRGARLALAGLTALSFAAALPLGSVTQKWLTLIVVLAVALLAWLEPARRRLCAQPLLFLALTLLLCPLAVFLAAQFLPPVFAARYFLPTVFATTILLAAFFENSFAQFSAGLFPQKVVFAVGVLTILTSPLYAALKLPANDVPPNGVSASVLEQLAPARMPIVVEDPFSFLPLYLRERARGATCVYILDRKAAEVSQYNSALVNYDVMERLYSDGYLQDHFLTTQEFLAANSNFLVLHKPGFAWFDTRIVGNPEFTWRNLGKVNGSELIAIKRANRLPAAGSARPKRYPVRPRSRVRPANAPHSF